MFGDASISGTAAAIYAVTYQSSQVSQGLVTAKARLSKKDLTIPRLDLVAMHMAANLCQNLKSALEDLFETSMDGLTVPWHCIGLEVKETTNSL